MSEIIEKQYNEPEYIASQSVQMGTIHISNDVLSKIVGMAAQSTAGVSSMSVGLTEGIAKSISGKSLQKGLMYTSKTIRQPSSCASTFNMVTRCTRFAVNFNIMFKRL